MKFFYVISLLCAGVSIFNLLGATLQDSAPKQAAAAAIAIGWAVVPYVIARSIEKLGGPREVRIAGGYPPEKARRDVGGEQDGDRREPRL